MKNLKTKSIAIVFIVLLGITMSSISRAAVESKPGTSHYDDITASASYQLCYDMRNADSTLGNNSLDPHLTLNADWGAVAYLGASGYGAVRNNYGTDVKINGKNYKSTTKNITGVMNMGYNNYSHTASLMGGNAGQSPEYTINLKNNLETKYVENLLSDNTKGQAIIETQNWWDSYISYPLNSLTPVAIREGIFGLTRYYNSGESGGSSVTFRPVIWN